MHAFRRYDNVNVRYLFSQLNQSEEAREVEQTDLNKVTEEFTTRISESEKKITQVLKVKL